MSLAKSQSTALWLQTCSVALQLRTVQKQATNSPRFHKDVVISALHIEIVIR